MQINQINITRYIFPKFLKKLLGSRSFYSEHLMLEEIENTIKG